MNNRSILHGNFRAVRPAWPLALALLLVGGAVAEAASPSLNRILPRGAQRGTEVELVFEGARLGDAVEIVCYTPGFTVQAIEADGGNRVKAKVAIAPDCALGEHAMRVRTKTGVSELRNFFVGDYPNVEEAEPNSDFNAPQTIAMNVTVNGVITNEDVDYYLVEAKQGDRISVEVEGIRLGAMFDPYVSIMDAKRFDLAANDDSALLLQDSFASVIAPADGPYIIQVRESAYGGNDNCRYRLHVGHFPRPTAVYPAGGPAGESFDITLIGDVTGPIAQAIAATEPTDAYRVFAEQNGHRSPSPNLIRISPFANVLEAEPNNRRGEPNVTEVAPPLAWNGIIETPGDVDHLAFNAKKDQVFDVHVYARRLRSPLDAVLNIYGPDGKRVEGNDDSGGLDSYVRFTAPAEGQYTLSVRDHLRSGGPDYVYRIEVTPVQPVLTLTLPEFVQFSQERHAIAVPQGNRMATVVRVTRRDFGGELALAGADLPDGVTMHTQNIKGNVTEVPIVFEATAEAPVAGRLATLHAQHVENESIRGRYGQSVRLVYGEPNNTPYYTHEIDRLAMAVTESAPFRLTLVQPKVPVVRNGSMQLKVVAERSEGFTKAITLSLPYTPPGVSGAGNVTIKEGETEALYPINADGNAPPGVWPIVVLGQADAGAGPVWASTQLAQVEVATPFVAASMEMAAAEQGQPAQVVYKLEQLTAFEGEAKIELVGLPPKTATTPLTITSGSEEVIFTVTTEADAPVGQHKSLFCVLTITKEGEPILHNIGQGGVLRIDAPPPAPKKEEPKAEAPPAPEQPKEQAKPLSRLEKLRLEQQKREAGE